MHFVQRTREYYDSENGIDKVNHNIRVDHNAREEFFPAFGKKSKTLILREIMTDNERKSYR